MIQRLHTHASNFKDFKCLRKTTDLSKLLESVWKVRQFWVFGVQYKLLQDGFGLWLITVVWVQTAFIYIPTGIYHICVFLLFLFTPWQISYNKQNRSTGLVSLMQSPYPRKQEYPVRNSNLLQHRTSVGPWVWCPSYCLCLYKITLKVSHTTVAVKVFKLNVSLRRKGVSSHLLRSRQKELQHCGDLVAEGYCPLRKARWPLVHLLA